MRSRILAFVVCAITLSAPARAQTSVEPLLDEALTKTREMAFRTDQVDWSRLENQVRSAAAGAKDPVDLLAAFELLVEGLADGHSFVNASSEDRAEYRARYGREYDGLRPYRKVTSAFRSRREPEARSVPLGGRATAHLVTVPMKQGGGAPGTAYANALHANVAAGASANGTDRSRGS